MGTLLPHSALVTLRRARELEATELKRQDDTERLARWEARKALEETAAYLDRSRESYGRMVRAKAI